MIRCTALMVLATAAFALGACKGSKIVAPEDRGVCYFVVPQTDGTAKFNEVARNQPSLEMCAKELEQMRRRFVGMGGGAEEIAGSYQGQFLFLKREGIFTGQTWDGPTYPLLVRYNDMLVPPGAIGR